jgi:hypothetical protein
MAKAMRREFPIQNFCGDTTKLQHRMISALMWYTLNLRHSGCAAPGRDAQPAHHWVRLALLLVAAAALTVWYAKCQGPLVSLKPGWDLHQRQQQQQSFKDGDRTDASDIQNSESAL